MVPPFRADNGVNISLGTNVFINCNCIMIDTCRVTVGSRVLIAPNVSFYSGTHPLDPDLRNGTKGPEGGKEITIGDDCWIGGNVTICPGVHIGKGSTVGAGSVVTKVGLIPSSSTSWLLIAVGCRRVQRRCGKSSEVSEACAP